MGHSLTPVTKWLDTATRRIRFGPDRRAVRAELEAHLEDKALDLQRLFPSLSPAQAWAQAAADMGDAEEIGRDLARIHRPGLGYAWRISQLALLLTLAALAVRLLGVGWDYLQWRRAEVAQAPSEGIPFVCAEPLRIGPYTLRAQGTWRPENPKGGAIWWEEGYGTLFVTWQADTPLLWERPGLSGYWQGEDSLGNHYACHNGGLIITTGIDYGGAGTLPWQVVSCLNWEDSWPPMTALEWDGLLPDWLGEQTVLQVPEEAQWVRLYLDLGGEPAAILLEREEAAP